MNEKEKTDVSLTSEKVEKDESLPFKASSGRVKKIFNNVGITRVKKEVFPLMENKINEMIEKQVESINVPQDKKTVTAKDIPGSLLNEKKECIFPKAPFRETLRKYITDKHEFKRVTNDALSKLQLLVEQDVENVCRSAQQFMNNDMRKTLFPQDVESAVNENKRSSVPI